MRSLRDIVKQAPLTLEQLTTIEKTIIEHGEYTKESIRNEIDWFCTDSLAGPRLPAPGAGLPKKWAIQASFF